MSDHHRYQQCKPTGIDWFPSLPAHWDSVRLKTVARFWVSNVDKVPAEDEIAVRLCNYTDVYYNERIHPELDLMRSTATPSEIRRFHLQVGDVIITKDSEEWTDIAVPAVVTETAPDLVCGYHLAMVRANAARLYPSYLFRLFQAAGVNRQLQLAASGITRYSLPKSAIGEVRIPLPPLDEQKQIATYLDQETARIDKLAGVKPKQRNNGSDPGSTTDRLLRVLYEYRFSIISAAVVGEVDVRKHSPEEATAVCR